MIILQILENTLFTILYTVGIVIIIGLLIGILNNTFYYFLGRSSWKVSVMTAVIGTPVHELGHAMFAVIFGHKITSMKLFHVDKETGSLGHVEHSYKKKNVYQQMGNFFIGIGPILLGSAVLILLMLIFVNNLFFQLIDLTKDFTASNTAGLTATGISNIFRLLIDMLDRIFAVEMLSNVFWWVFIIIGSFIALHMKLSKSDIVGSIPGFFLYCVLALIFNVILAFIPTTASSTVMTGLIVGSSYIFCFLVLSLIFSIVLVSIAGLFYLIGRLIRR